MDIYLPTAALKPFVKNYIVIESQEEIVNRVLPGTSLVMSFRFKGRINYLIGDNKIKLPSSALTGINRSARLINYEGRSGAVLVIFKETGAAAFFSAPLYELFDLSISLDKFIHPSSLALVEEQLLAAQTNPERIAVVEQLLCSLLNERAPDGLILQALQEIHRSEGKGRIKALAGSLFISQDALEKRFRRAVGTSPKQFSSIVRMKSILHKRPPVQKLLTDRAFEADFFDQSHFNKNFKAFTGQSPADFFKSPVFW